MKQMSFMLFCCLFLTACPPIPHRSAYLYKIEYNAVGRGGSEYFLLEKGKLKYVENRQDTIAKNLKEKHYKEIYSFLKDINPDSLKIITIPSKKYQFDGALATTLKIFLPEQEGFSSPTFDHDNPPFELKGLINYIKSIAVK